MSTDSDNIVKVDIIQEGNSTIYKGTYLWVISSFKSKKDRSIESSKFSIPNFGRDALYFQMDRHVDNNQSASFVLSLRRTALQWTLCNCAISFSLILDGSDWYDTRMVFSSFLDSKTPELSLVSEEKLLHVMSAFGSGDTLTILCKFQLTKTFEDENLGCTSINQAMKCLLTTQTYADVILQIGNKSLKAHKALLTVRSPVFAAMFENEMKESKDNKVDITDISEETLQAFLRYSQTRFLI